MKPLVYIETTVASYLTARATRDMIAMARQQITMVWWEQRLGAFSPVISQLVLDEAARGDPGAAQRRLQVLTDFPLLEISVECVQLARRFIRPGAMPARATDDALHLAVCAVHGVDYLLTWNFRHIANAESRRLLERICLQAGYPFPAIATPDELMKGAL